MNVSLIAAVSENGVIGREGELPWHLPADLQRFKRLTTGHVIIMGRRTWESIGRPLPRRRHLVLTRQPGYTAEGITVVADVDAACRSAAADDEVFVIGGEAIYAAFLPRAVTLYLTRVHAVVEGDARFPRVDFAEWTLIESSRHEADERHRFPFTFETWKREFAAESG